MDAQGNAERRPALCLGNAALQWHACGHRSAHTCTDTLWSQMFHLLSPQAPTGRQKEGISDDRSLILSVTRPLKSIARCQVQPAEPRTLPVRALALGPQPLRAARTPFSLKSLGCGAHSLLTFQR